MLFLQTNSAEAPAPKKMNHGEACLSEMRIVSSAPPTSPQQATALGQYPSLENALVKPIDRGKHPGILQNGENVCVNTSATTTCAEAPSREAVHAVDDTSDVSCSSEGTITSEGESDSEDLDAVTEDESPSDSDSD